MTAEETLKDIASIIRDDFSDEELSEFVGSLGAYVSARSIESVEDRFQLLLVLSAALGLSEGDFEELIGYAKGELDKKKV